MRGRKTEILQIHYVFRVFRFLSPTKLNRNELAGYSKAHSIQPLCLAGVVRLWTYTSFEALKVRDLGSNRCPTISLSIIKLILLVYPTMHFPLKSKETRRSFACSFKHTLIHNGSTNFILLFHHHFIFCTQKAERFLGFSE